ncbi:MAG: hypothetical protein IT270_04015 [Saprospiraceae bacterium]|nr:hypothetical protein [Saprospiraceae bacterium]
MKNVLFTALAAIVLLTSACNNLDENLNNSMATELEARQKGLADYLARNKAIGEFNMASTKVPASLYNDPGTGFTTVRENLNMITSKYQATVDVYNDHLSKLSRLQEDYQNGKIKTEEAKQEFESINSNFKSIISTLDRADEFYQRTSDQYAEILTKWKTANPDEAAALEEAASKPGGGLFNSASNAAQKPATNAKKQ